jgi:exosome complex RNA-binding protein Rrp42 (RNase PH superfamily)
MYKTDTKIKNEIEDYIDSLILSKIDKKWLQINKDNSLYLWKLYVDIYLLDNLKLSLLQLISIGIKQLFKNMQLPKTILMKNELTNEIEYDLLENYEDISEDDKLMSFEKIEVPEIYIFGIFKNSFLLDPSEEELSISESLLMMSYYKNEINYVQSLGANLELSKIQEISNWVKKINLEKDKMDES